jgi:hypothetical protein
MAMWDAVPAKELIGQDLNVGVSGRNPERLQELRAAGAEILIGDL